MNLDSEMKRLIEGFLHPKPRQVCICMNFRPGTNDPEYEFIMCRNCKGWKSKLELAAQSGEG